MSIGDTGRRYVSGELFRLQAAHVNRWQDAARAIERLQRPLGRDSGISGGGVHLVKNASGDDLVKGQILGIDGPLFDPSDTGGAHAQSFAARVAFTGVTPATPDHAAAFVVAQHSILNGKLGRCIVVGATVATVNVIDEDHTVAVVEDGEYVLRSADSGTVGAPILWKASGLGEVDALIGVGFASAAPRIRAQILGSSSAATNRWSYSWEEVEPGATGGTYATKTGGRNSTADGLAWNQREASNAPTGVQGNGIDVANLTGTMALQPAPAGLVIELRESGTGWWEFDYENGVDGSC